MTDTTPERDRASLDPLTAFAELSRIVVGSEPLSAVLQRIAELAKRTIEGSTTSRSP